METTISFGYWIRRQRKALDLTQQALADRIGCSLAAIKKIESDERRASRQIAERLDARVSPLSVQGPSLSLEGTLTHCGLFTPGLIPAATLWQRVRLRIASEAACRPAPPPA